MGFSFSKWLFCLFQIGLNNYMPEGIYIRFILAITFNRLISDTVLLVLGVLQEHAIHHHPAEHHVT